jgi:hypothetical protein
MSDSSIFSIIMGVALIGIGLALEPISLGASSLLVGLGGSLAGSAIYDEVKDSFQDKKTDQGPSIPIDTKPEPNPQNGILV